MSVLINSTLILASAIGVRASGFEGSAMGDFADSSSAELAIKQEAAFGVPETSGFDPFRFTGESLNFNVTTVESQEIDPSRQVADLVRVNAGAGGDVNFEMSFGSFDKIFQGLFLNQWQNEYKAINVANAVLDKTNSTITLPGEDMAAAGVVPGQWMRVTTPTQSLYLRLNTVGTTVSTFDAPAAKEPVSDETAVMSVSTSRIIIGKDKSQCQFTLQKAFPDVSQFFVYNGMRSGGMSLDMTTEQIMTGTFTFEGLDGIRHDASQIGTPNQSNGNDVMSAVANVSNIRKDGVQGTFSAKSVTTDFQNAMRSQTAVGTLGAVGIGIGRAVVKGGMSIYLEDGQLFDDLRNGTEFSFDYRLQDNSGNAYVITYPRAKFAALEIVAGAIDQDVMATGEYQALLPDASNDVVSEIQIDRLPGVVA